MKPIFLIILSVFLCTGVAFAQTETATETAQAKETEAVKVTATRTERNLNEVPMTVNVITEEDIKLNPAATVADLLKNIPGIELENNGVAGAPKIRIRGESSGRTLILIDGVRLVEHMPVAGAGIVMVSPGDIERIEVIKGPASVLYGSDAIGGVVNIITKKGSDKPFNVNQRMVYDSSSRRFDNFWSVYGSYEGFFYRGSANFVDSDDRETPNGKIADSDYERNTYTGTLGYKWDHGSVTLGYSKFDSEINYQMGGAGGAPQYFEWDREVFNADVVFNNITDYFVRMQLSGNYQDVKRHTITKSTGVATERDVKGYDITLQTEWLLGNHYVTVGGEYNPEEASQEYSNNNRVTKADVMNASVFIQDEWSFYDDFILTLGLRQTWYETKITKNTNPFVVDAGDMDDSKLLGSVGLVYTGLKDFSFRGQFSQGYKIPPLYYSNIGHSMLGSPNPDLKPEESNNYEVGMRMQKWGFDLDWAIFYSQAKNYISMIGTMGNYHYENLDKTETIGSELGVSYTWEQLTPYFNLTYIHRTTKFDSPTATISKTTNSRTPRWTGNFGLRWESEFLGPRLFADLNLKWADSTKTESETGVKTPYHGWAVVNLQGGVQGRAINDSVDYFFAVDFNNIFGKAYMPSWETMEMPGRHVVLSGGFTF